MRYQSVLSYGSALPRPGRCNLLCDTSALHLARSNVVSDRNMPGRRLEFARCIPLERHRSSSHDIQASQTMQSFSKHGHIPSLSLENTTNRPSSMSPHEPSSTLYMERCHTGCLF